MIRSNFAVTRLIVLPYAALLTLYLLMVGGGSAWLYLQVREGESRLLIGELRAVLEPFAEKLSSVDAIALMADAESWLDAEVRKLFVDLPPLREVSVRGHKGGVEVTSASGAIINQAVSPLPADARRASAYPPAADRLHAESDARFVIRFDLTAKNEPLVRLDFGFDRAELLARVDEGLGTIKRAVLWFGLAGGVSILMALGITIFAMHTTRRVESYFQDLYRRASITEMAAELVHDLRNPLMALRTNVKALLVSPEQTSAIVAELDRDIVTLSDKLSGFLKLTRSHDGTFVPTDIEALIQEAARLAEPVLARHGLGLELDIAADLPQPLLQEAAIRDALLNIMINAGQSGQTDGAVRVWARRRDGVVTIAVEDQGEGIAQEHLPRLFEAFFTTKADGNGLGLAIVRRIVEAHQGRVQAENRAEGGVRVLLTLPLKQKEVPHWWTALSKTSPT